MRDYNEPTTAIPGAEKREPAVHEIIRSMQIEIERLQKNIEIMESRLSPAMAPPGPTNEKAAEGIGRTLPELLERFNSFRNAARNVNARMEDILRRLEI